MAPPLQRKPQHVPILALALLWISTSTAQSEVPTNERCPIGHAGKSCSYHAMIRPGQKNCIIHRDFIIGENEVFRNLEGRRYDNVTLLETMEIRVQYNPDQDMILLWDALFEEHVAISKNDKGDDYVVKHYRADGVEHDRHLPTAINRFKITKMSLYSEWILIEYDFVDLSFDILYGGQNVFIFFDEDDSLSFIPTTSECFVQERIPPKVTSEKVRVVF
ncbi:hypothetical protein LSH36_1093g00069 [Paralvinella palmiformis]|uniref:Uncharacterized protein n=1 Tax=Paralvinella palmiformis TaxID=53620 RepID=A0AAD9IWB1_9ANNE|nr:hypothetical protein LSH36_1093g00069 [Paralvinella palmiformis]